MEKLSTRILAMVYAKNLKNEYPSPERVAEELEIDYPLLRETFEAAVARGLLEPVSGGLRVSKGGRARIRVVMVGGVFDIIHPGHLYTVEAARRLGDVVVVSVARDSTAIRLKGRRPVNDEERRRSLVEALKPVDVALLGSEKDIYETVVKVSPDVIALGYDQKHDEKVMVQESARRGVRVEVVRLGSPIPEVKSSEILKNREAVQDF